MELVTSFWSWSTLITRSNHLLKYTLLVNCKKRNVLVCHDYFYPQELLTPQHPSNEKSALENCSKSCCSSMNRNSHKSDMLALGTIRVDWPPRLALPGVHVKKSSPILGRSKGYSWLHLTNLGSMIANMNSKFAKKMCRKQGLPTGPSERVNSPRPP